jgi:transcription initiation factor TFIIIB Brf1 subunit/transcription initiation factor TFIIB
LADLASFERKHDRNFGTEMHPILKSTKIGPETRQWWNRVRRYLGRKSSSERRLVEAFCDIDRVCSYMGLPRGVQDDLCYGARKLAGRMRGSSRLRILMLMVYLACERRNAPRDLREIDLAFQELFGEEYSRVRDRNIDRTSNVSGLSKYTQARIPQLVRVLGYGNL